MATSPVEAPAAMSAARSSEMDGEHFDRLVKSLSAAETRRRLLGLCARLPTLSLLAGLGLPLLAGRTAEARRHKGKGKRKAKHRRDARHRRHDQSPASAKAAGARECTPNKPCAQWCASVFGDDTPEAGACMSAATKCQGPCYQCGPGCQDDCQTLCGQSCVELGTDQHCSQCDDACTAPAICANGSCCTPTSCAAQGKDCGTIPDGCGGPDLDCGTCTASGTTPLCVNNVCTACSGAHPCPSGCCDGSGACQPGTTNAVCGAAGTTCQVCSNPTPVCTNQVCGCTSSDQCPANTICDGGACHACDVCATCPSTTVQAAIAAASAGDTLRICPGTYTEHLTIDKSLSLIGAGQGNGASDTLLSGGGSGRVVEIASWVTVTLRTLRITGGDAGVSDGGGIVNVGTVTLHRCTVTGNHANSHGGGIANGGTLTLTDCTVSTNTAAAGGGIASNGAIPGTTVTLTGCQITGNTALAGGGLYNENGGTYSIDSTTITGNTATRANRGGGIDNDASGGTVTLQNGSMVSGNTPNNCVGTITGSGCAL